MERCILLIVGYGSNVVYMVRDLLLMLGFNDEMVKFINKYFRCLCFLEMGNYLIGVECMYILILKFLCEEFFIDVCKIYF